MQNPVVKGFFDDATNTITFLLRDPSGTSCAIVDSVLDFDYASGRTDTRSADVVVAYNHFKGTGSQVLFGVSLGGRSTFRSHSH